MFSKVDRLRDGDKTAGSENASKKRRKELSLGARCNSIHACHSADSKMPGTMCASPSLCGMSSCASEFETSRGNAPLREKITPSRLHFYSDKYRSHFQAITSTL